jgi:heme o synthase
MLPSVDPEGQRTGRQAVSHTLALMLVSLVPVGRLAGPVYFWGALVCGLLFLAASVQFSRTLSSRSARQMFFASILYLPLLLGLMVVDKIKY